MLAFYAVHIPFNGGNPAQLALLSGQVDFNFDNLATAAPNIKAGKLKALAVTTAQRASALPDIPAMAETLKGFEVDTWWGLVAPANTPPAMDLSPASGIFYSTGSSRNQSPFWHDDGRACQQHARSVCSLHEARIGEV